MDSPSSILRLLGRLAKAAVRLVRIEKPSAMIGLPPSAQGMTGRPTDIAQHARAVAREWDDVGEAFVQKTMRELGIPDHRIGAPDYEQGGVTRAFLSEETRGGTNDLAGRLYVDSGSLNPMLNADAIGPAAQKLWEKSRLRDRIEAVIAHEDLESRGMLDDEVVQRAPDTNLPIGANARKILRSMADGAK